MKRILVLTATIWLLLGSTAGAQSYTQSEGPLDTGGADTLNAGDTVEVCGDGFEAGGEVEVLLDDGTGETSLGTGTADDSGTACVEVTLPDDFGGDGVLYMRGNSEDGGTRVLGIELRDGQVGQLAFTGTSSSTRWLVTVALGLIVIGSGTLITNARRRTTG